MTNNFVADLVEKMGGNNVFAVRVGVSVKTVRNWKNNNLIPNDQNQRTEVIRAAQDLGIIIRGSDFVYEMKEGVDNAKQ